MTRLPLVQGRLADTTCFAAHAKYGVPCMRRRCRSWLKWKAHQNCVMVATSRGRYTLEEIGRLYGVTRARICNIQMRITDRLRALADDL